MPFSEAALGMRAHSGWAVVVAVAGGVPVLRRRVEMAPGTGDRARQPYHAAAEMDLKAAESFLTRAEAKSVEMAATAIREIARDYHVQRAAVLVRSRKPLPELSKILAAHPLIHTAEGVFFRNVLRTACGECKFATQDVLEQEVAPELLAKAAAMGKILGPPWTMDEKLSAAAALHILSL
jgi:hypothetical protein